MTTVEAVKPGPLSNIRVPYALLTLVALVIVWEFGAAWSQIPAYMLPSPTSIFSAMQAMQALLFTHTGITLTVVLLGFSLSILIGVPIAMLITYSSVFDRAVYPLIVGSQTIPKVAIAPLLLAAFGYGLAPKIVIVTLIAFFPIVINTVVGLRSVSEEMLHLARSMGASPLQTFVKFRLPQALPSIFAGLKLASVLAVIGAVVAEFVGATGGLGYIIMIAGSNFRMDQQFAAVIVLSLSGMIFFWLIGMVERALMPWHISVRGGGANE